MADNDNDFFSGDDFDAILTALEENEALEKDFSAVVDDVSVIFSNILHSYLYKNTIIATII